jgi:YggT family protein
MTARLHTPIRRAQGRIAPVAETFVRTFAQLFLTALWLLVLGRVLMSWIDPTRGNAISQFLFQATEPLLAPVRRFLPQAGMFDFSALVVLLVLGALMRAVVRM